MWNIKSEHMQKEVHDQDNTAVNKKRIDFLNWIEFR